MEFLKGMRKTIQYTFENFSRNQAIEIYSNVTTEEVVLKTTSLFLKILQKQVTYKIFGKEGSRLVLY